MLLSGGHSRDIICQYSTASNDCMLLSVWSVSTNTVRLSFERRIDWLQLASKFGVKIWTRIRGSCLGLLQTKSTSTSTKKNNHCQMSTRKNQQIVLWSRGYPPVVCWRVSEASNDSMTSMLWFLLLVSTNTVWCRRWEFVLLCLCSWDFCSCSWNSFVL